MINPAKFVPFVLLSEAISRAVRRRCDASVLQPARSNLLPRLQWWAREWLCVLLGTC